jgi:Ribbon-helix-helix protein, copG family
MTKSARQVSGIKEPLQIYMTSDERRLLDALSADTGLSRAEILRRGLRSFAAEQGGEGGPMQALLLSLRQAPWARDVAADHDDQLARAYTDRHGE